MTLNCHYVGLFYRTNHALCGAQGNAKKRLTHSVSGSKCSPWTLLYAFWDKSHQLIAVFRGFSWDNTACLLSDAAGKKRVSASDRCADVGKRATSIGVRETSIRPLQQMCVLSASVSWQYYSPISATDTGCRHTITITGQLLSVILCFAWVLFCA